MRAQGVSFRHAVELPRPDAAFTGAPTQAEHSTVVKLPPPVDREAGDAQLLSQVAHFYHETLKGSPEELAHLQQRGLTDAEVIGRFQLSHANRTLGYRLRASNRAAGAEMRGRLQKLGVLRESGHERFNGSLVIPIVNTSGEVAQMYGRKILDQPRPGTPMHLYLPGPQRGVFNEEALACSKEIILCESLIDAPTFWCAGFRHVTASNDVNGFTEDHRAALEKRGVWTENSNGLSPLASQASHLFAGPAEFGPAAGNRPTERAGAPAQAAT